MKRNEFSFPKIKLPDNFPNEGYVNPLTPEDYVENKINIAKAMTVFRSESKSPDIILNEGMWGKNIDSDTTIYEHVFKKQESKYVSTSKIIEVPTIFSGCISNIKEWGERQYLYIIRANPDVSFDAELTINSSNSDLSYSNVVGVDCREICMLRVKPEDIVGWIIVPNDFRFELNSFYLDKQSSINFITADTLFKEVEQYSQILTNNPNNIFVNPNFTDEFPDDLPDWFKAKLH